MLIGWTTVGSRETAHHLAGEAVALALAVCVQVEGPVTSHYRWQGTQEKTEEFRLTFKLMANQLAPLGAWLHAHHPYETPEWVVVRAEHVAEKYLSWALANSSPLSL
jgi:periplasmic divalent cation tolerance protein